MAKVNLIYGRAITNPLDCMHQDANVERMHFWLFKCQAKAVTKYPCKMAPHKNTKSAYHVHFALYTSYLLCPPNSPRISRTEAISFLNKLLLQNLGTSWCIASCAVTWLTHRTEGQRLRGFCSSTNSGIIFKTCTECADKYRSCSTATAYFTF